MLSQRSRYALRAMMVLATNAVQGPMRTGEIARTTKVSPKFLEAILLELRKAGLLISQRGCKGGFQLARPAKQISFADIVRVTDGSLAMAPCANEFSPRQCEDCFGEEHCQIRRAMVQARENADRVLQAYDLDAVARRKGYGRDILAGWSSGRGSV